MSQRARRILVVEDQRLIAADIESTLARLGYAVVGSVPSGEEAIQKAGEVSPELVLMDIRLRGKMDGTEAAAIIRERFDIPIVFLTAYADEETIVRAKATAPFGYIVKPFNERELRAAVEVALYKHDTERLLSEERARREAAEQIKFLVDAIKDYAIIMIDMNGRIVSWNSGAERLAGYTAEEIVGGHFSIFYEEEARLQKYPEWELEIARREGRYEEEGWRVRKDGTRFWAAVTIAAVRDAAGALRGFAKVTRDLTERRQAEDRRERLLAELKEAVRARDEFLQIASHELKTPLTPLQMQLGSVIRSLRSMAVQDQRLIKKIEVATRQTERISSLVENLLDVSRITGGRLALQLEEFDLTEIVGDVAERFQVEAQKAGCALTVVALSPLVGRWDRLRLEQVISNLLSNAIKYGPKRPVEVDLGERGGMIRIAVTDHGIGIDEAARERIFERFERAVSTRHYGGLGLGLFITRQICEAHGGSIAVESRPGNGSTFTVLLPREPRTRPDAAGGSRDEGRS
jgi:PAS domain S-box-containing protein